MHLQEVGKEARKLYASFIQSIDEFRPALWRYCLHLTTNVWDAEDLMQEALMKAFASLGQIRHPFMPKSYLFRIASNTWIDQCRKIQPVETNLLPESKETKDPQHDYSLHVLEGIEILISSLTPRHVVVVLLMEVFDFSAREVADMLQTTEGAVHAILSRARAKLKSIHRDGKTEKRRNSAVTDDSLSLISRYVEAFHLKDTAMLMDLYAEHAEIHLLNTGIVRGRDSIQTTMNWSSYPESFHAEWKWLWGQPVILLIANRGHRQTIWRAQILKFEEGKVVKDKNYFFCREVMLEIADYLQMPIDPDTQSHYEQPWNYSSSCPIGINTN